MDCDRFTCCSIFNHVSERRQFRQVKMKLIECVPNFSEGRDLNKIKIITDAIINVAGITVLDVDPGEDTNRTVVTIVGEPEAVAEAAFIGIQSAANVLDMRSHTGAHARMGATDVCPFIPISEVTMDECIEVSKHVGARVGNELGIPIYLYEKSAQKVERGNLATVRQGEYEGLEKKLKNPEWKPDYGPADFNPKTGATAVGAREFLIAYNINLNTKDKRLATDIAFELREKGRSKRFPNPLSKNLLDGEIVRKDNGKPVKIPGMFKNVKAVGWIIESYHRAQISINFTNYKQSPVHEVFDAACTLANERGLRVTGSELVGLIPMAAVKEAGIHYLKKQGHTPGVPESEIIETAIQSLGLHDVAHFDPEEKIIEYAIQNEEANLMNSTMNEFVEELSTNSPAPGGGSVAALAGSLAAGLAAMVSALTHEKKGFELTKDEMESIGLEAQHLKDRFIALVDEDTSAFNQMMDAGRLPSKTETEKSDKKSAMEKAAKNGVNIPMETAESALKILEMTAVLVEKGNPNSVSDAGVAAEMAHGAVRGGIMNVRINLSGIGDQEFVKEAIEKSETLIRKADSLQDEIYSKTMNTIQSS
jgi:glutamate formiminotransferase/formiminotetrahydrofolate cyclodeaminase